MASDCGSFCLRLYSIQSYAVIFVVCVLVSLLHQTLYVAIIVDTCARFYVQIAQGIYVPAIIASCLAMSCFIGRHQFHSLFF